MTDAAPGDARRTALVTDSHRWCHGPLHPAGVLLPVDDEHWYFHHRTPHRPRLQGKPRSHCKFCHRIINSELHAARIARETGNTNTGLVPMDTVKPMVEELLQRTGNPHRAAQLSGIGESVLYRWKAGVWSSHATRSTVARVVSALLEARKEDRRNGAVQRNFVKARHAQVRQEDAVLRSHTDSCG